jgi:hypothetical protein
MSDSKITSPPPLDLDAVRLVRRAHEAGLYGQNGAAIGHLLAQYDNLAARYAFAVASLTSIEREVSAYDPHSDRLLLREIAAIHGRAEHTPHLCARCPETYPCHTLRLIEGKA